MEIEPKEIFSFELTRDEKLSLVSIIEYGLMLLEQTLVTGNKTLNQKYIENFIRHLEIGTRVQNELSPFHNNGMFRFKLKLTTEHILKEILKGKKTEINL